MSRLRLPRHPVMVGVLQALPWDYISDADDFFEHREQFTSDLIDGGGIYHVSKCNQEMLYLYYQ